MLYRHSPSRNHRAKGINLKHGIQICLLLAVCFWLIYQIKHSHDKKKEYAESDEKNLHQRTTEELIKLGRKDIRPRVEDGTISTNENNDEQEEEEEEEETTEEKESPKVDGNNDEQEEDEESTEEKVEEDKAEDEAQYNVEEKEDEGTGHGDDEIDVREQEKADTNIDREGELVDEEEREDSAENGTQEMDSEHDAHEQISSEDIDHDGDDRSLNEAREEHYKADDASSAVTHDIHTAASGNENEHVDNEGGSRKYIEVKGVQIAGDNQQLNATGETKVDHVNNSEDGSSSNDTVTEIFNSHLATNSSTEFAVENHDAPSQNTTENEPKLDSDQGSLTEGASAEESNLQTIALKGDNNSVVNVNVDHSDSNSTGLEVPKDAESHLEDFPNSNNNAESFVSKNVIKAGASDEAGNYTDSALEKNDEIKAGKSDKGGGGEIDTSWEKNDEIETLDSTMAENPEDIPHDTIDISDASTSLEETNTRVDLDTLPEIQTEGTNSEDVAAE